MVDLSGGRRATKGLTLDHKRPRLRHFQMGDPPPRSPRAQHVIKRISQTCKSAKCDLKLRLENYSQYVVALALRKVNFVSRNQLASNKSALCRIASFCIQFCFRLILA